LRPRDQTAVAVHKASFSPLEEIENEIVAAPETYGILIAKLIPRKRI
jgi:hypothetical protein